MPRPRMRGCPCGVIGAGNGRYVCLPEIQIFGGGVTPVGWWCAGFHDYRSRADDYTQALDWMPKFIISGEMMAEAGLLQGVADEGGVWPASRRTATRLTC